MISIENIERQIVSAKQQTLQDSFNRIFNLNPGVRLALLTKTDKIAARVLYILSNEQIFIPCLDELNQELAEGQGASHLPTRPLHYIEIHSAKLPVPPSTPLQNGDLLCAKLSSVLLRQEQKHGVNAGRQPNQICQFVGPVPEADFTAVINRGDLWEDYPFDIMGLYHGRFSHRIQYYVITKAIERNPKLLDELTETSDLLKQFVLPTAHFFRFFSSGFTRAYWNLAFETDRNNPHYDLLKKTNDISGPTILMEYLLSKTSFEKRSLLAHTIHHSMCQPLFYVASKIQKTACEALQEYAFASANQGKCSVPFYNALEEHFKKTVSNLFATQFSPTAAAVHLHSHRNVYKALDTNRPQSVTVKKEDVESLHELFGQLQISGTPHPYIHTLHETKAVRH